MRKILFDTSVLLPALIKSHLHHQAAAPWLDSVENKKIRPYLSTHCLAELFSNLTRYPHTPPIGSSTVHKIITDWILKHFAPIEFQMDDYLQAIKRAGVRDLRGAIIYDSLHIQAAVKNKIKEIITFNRKDFERLAAPNEFRIINPLNESP